MIHKNDTIIHLYMLSIIWGYCVWDSRKCFLKTFFINSTFALSDLLIYIVLCWYVPYTKPKPQWKITHATMKTPCAVTKPNKHIFFKEKKKNTPSEGGSRDGWYIDSQRMARNCWPSPEAKTDREGFLLRAFRLQANILISDF